MRRVGDVVTVAQGVAVVRAPDETTVDVGTEVIDESLDPVGRVVDVFGPVDRPYFAVSGRDGVDLVGLVGSACYTRNAT